VADRDFPESFLWGAATAAHQVEGGNTNSDWWAFEHAPYTAARESSGDGIDHWNRYADDLRLLASLGHSAHRFSVEWARVEPAEGEFSSAAIRHYRAVLDEVHANGMVAFVTLQHFTLPAWFAAKGGWTAPDGLDLFERYVRHVTTALGDSLDYVCTVNEPQMVALHGYLEGYHPPGITNPTLWKRVGRILLEAHHRAVAATRAATDAAVGLVVQLPLLTPAREDAACVSFCDTLRHEIVDLYLNGVAVDGGDWLGVQYYRKNWVDPAIPTIFALPPPGTPVTQMGWAVHPDGLREVLHRAARTGLPLVITENGIATGDDEERLNYLESHLRAAAQAMQEGVDLRGYLHWSAFDNFEWSEGYGPTFGLVAIDRDDNFRRVPRPSAHAFARVARSGRIPDLRGTASVIPPGTAGRGRLG
jgi:beta-glucosidase